MKKIICDFCKKRDGFQRKYYAGQECMPSGSTESVYNIYDLCPICERDLLLKFINKIHKIICLSAFLEKEMKGQTDGHNKL